MLGKNRKFSLVHILILFGLSGCVQPKPEVEAINSTDQLFHELPAELNLKFARATREIKHRKYNHEAAKWLSDDGLLEATSSYGYLFKGYFFSSESVTPFEEEVKNRFEDRIEGKITFVNNPEETYADKYALFSMEDGACIFYRDYRNLGFSLMNVSWDQIFVGDSVIKMHFCDYTGRPITEETIALVREKIKANKALDNP